MEGKIYCTKRLIKYTIGKRLFMLFERDKPLVLTLSYKQMTPRIRTSREPGLVFSIDHFHFTKVHDIDTECKNSYTKRVSSYDEANKIIENIKAGRCITCQNTKQCIFFNSKI